MDESSALIESILREEDENVNHDDDSGWQTVKYPKRHRKTSNKLPESFYDYQKFQPNGEKPDVFRSIEQHSEERLRRALEAQKVEPLGESKQRSDEEDDDSDADLSGNADNAETRAKKLKQKKPKKPKITVSEAASKIDASNLESFLVEASVSYESQQDIQLMRFADYFGRAFASVSASQFPWMKILKESPVMKMVDIPLSHIPEAVYKTSVDWINQRSAEALGSFVLWSLDSILADLASHQGTVKGSKKVVQQTPSKSQVAIFVVLAMALRRKPEALITILPMLKENPKYQGQEKLPVTVWMIVQASQGDLVVGLYMWVQLLLPLLGTKLGSNPQSRDLILQLVERILSFPKARPILVNGAVRKGERLVPPSALELLMRATFPPTSARVKATERFEVVYPILKEVALAGSPGSKAMKQVAQQILNFTFKAAGEDVPELSREASDIFIWCLTQNADSYKQWDKIYVENIEASVVVLRKLAGEWKDYAVKHPSFDPLRETLKSFRQKNEKALAGGEDATHMASFKEADKHCKAIMSRLSRSTGCLKKTVIVSVMLAVLTTLVFPNIQSLDWKKLSDSFNLP